MTNYHVVSDACRVEILTEDNQAVKVSYMRNFSEELDIAVLALRHTIQCKDLETGSFTNLSKGDEVVAIGSPLGLKNTVSKGVYSGTVDDGDITKIQFTAAISNGSSGGALFSSDGKVIGVTSESFVYGQNMNLAIPVEVVTELCNSEAEVIYFREKYICKCQALFYMTR